MKLTILSREYCHLCSDMIAALQALQGRFPFELEVIDVDSRPDLEAKWGERVPALLEGERELCHYHLDPGVVDALVARMQ